MTSSDTEDLGGPPRALLIAAVAVAVVAIGIVLVIAATRQAPPQPVAVPAVPAPQAGNSACRALLAALPQRLGDYQRAPLAQPAPEGVTPRRPGPDSAPGGMRCGLHPPLS